MGHEIVVFGVGGLAEVIYAYLTEDSDHEVVAFTVHEEYLTEKKFKGLHVVPFSSLEKEYTPTRYRMFVAMGHSGFNSDRTRVYEQCKAKGYRCISYFNSKAIHWGKLVMGENCLVCESSVIQAGVTMGNNVFIRSACNIGHHTVIDDHCFIASGAVIAGKCRIGRGSFIGVNATIRDRIVVASNSVVGAGALILHDTVEDGVYKGHETELSGQRRDR